MGVALLVKLYLRSQVAVCPSLIEMVLFLHDGGPGGDVELTC